MSIKKMDLNEFVDHGYLQELNRQFLHPLGLALEAITDGGDIIEFGGVWDYREDPEGMLFSEATTKEKVFVEKYQNVQKELDEKRKYREETLGYYLQPVPGVD